MQRYHGLCTNTIVFSFAYSLDISDHAGKNRLARTYQVTFCSYAVFPNRTEFVNFFSLRHDRDNELLSNAIQVFYVELSKLKELLKKPVNTMADLEKWALFFRYANDSQCRER